MMSEHENENEQEREQSTNQIQDTAGDVNLQVGRDFELEGDIVGRDKVEGDKITAGGDIAINTIAGDQSNVGRDQVINNFYGGIPEEDEEEPAPGEPPYKGSQNYTRLDADIYTGREELLAHCLSHLHDSPLLAITGQSRIGKSSFIRGGLVPALKSRKHHTKGGLPPAGSSRWPIYVITPSTNPLESLGASLTRDAASVRTAFTVAEDMKADNRTLSLMARQLSNESGAERILLVIDEFEELFTVCEDEELRGAFIDNLMTAINSPTPRNDSSVTVVLSIKAMYMRGELERYEDLCGVIERNKVVIPVPDQKMLRRVIEEPAAAGNWDFEQGLVDLMLREVGNEPGALALLADALHHTWQRRRGRTLTYSGYGEVGNVRLTLVDKAELVYTQGLTHWEQDGAQNLFMRLTELGEGTQDGRRAISLTQMAESSETESMGKAMLMLLQKLADANLIVITEQELEFSHECLVRQWPRLRGWVEANREELRTQRQLTRDAEQWLGSNRHPDSLYRGLRLAKALDMIHEANFALNPLEEDFLSRSKDAVDQEEAEKEAVRQKQLADAEQIATLERQRAGEQQKRAEEQKEAAEGLRRSTKRLMWAMGFSLLLTVIALYATYAAQTSQAIVAEKSRVIRARELASYTINNVGVYPQRALLLAIEAMSVYGEDPPPPDSQVLAVTTPLVPEAIEAFRQALANVGGVPISPVPGIYDKDSAANGVALSADGRWMAAGFANGHIALWDQTAGVITPTLISENSPYSTQAVLRLTFSPDDHYLYSSHDGNVILQWDLTNLNNPPLMITDGSSGVNQIALGANNEWVVAGGDDGRVLVWPINNLTGPPTVLTDHTDQVYAVAFSPDGSWLATGSQDTDVYIYTVADFAQTPIKVDTHNEPIFAIDFRRDGQQLVTAGGTPPWIALNSADAVAHVWDLSNGIDPAMRPIADLRDHNEYIIDAKYSPDGQWLITASYDQTLRIYKTNEYTLSPLVLRGHEGALTNVAFAPDSQSIVTSSEDKTLRTWYVSADVGGMIASPITLPEPDTFITSLAVHESDKWLAVATKSGSVFLYNQDRVLNAETIGSQSLGKHSKAVHAIAFSPIASSNQWLAAGGNDGVIKLWSLGEALAGATPIELVKHTEAVMEVAFSPDGRWLVSGGHEGAVYAWDLENLSANPILLGAWESGFIHTLQFAPLDIDTFWLVATSGPAPEVFDRTTQNKILLWSYAPEIGWQSDPTKLIGHTDSIVAIDISADGRFLATGSADHTLAIWHLDDLQRPPVMINDYPDGIRDVEFTHNGELLAVSGWSTDIYVWDTIDIQRPRPPYILRGHTQWVNAISIDPNGDWLASVSHDGSIRLWDLDSLFDLTTTERELELDEIVEARDERLSQTANLTQSIILSNQEGHASHVAFSHDNEWLITTSSDYTTKMWSLDLVAMMELACVTAGRSLLNDETEWQLYFPDEVYAPRCNL